MYNSIVFGSLLGSGLLIILVIIKLDMLKIFFNSS